MTVPHRELPQVRRRRGRRWDERGERVRRVRVSGEAEHRILVAVLRPPAIEGVATHGADRRLSVVVVLILGEGAERVGVYVGRRVGIRHRVGERAVGGVAPRSGVAGVRRRGVDGGRGPGIRRWAELHVGKTRGREAAAGGDDHCKHRTVAARHKRRKAHGPQHDVAMPMRPARGVVFSTQARSLFGR